jgi:hypothetical protein
MWFVFDDGGACCAQGDASTRALAAALVIRTIARGVDAAVA